MDNSILEPIKKPSLFTKISENKTTVGIIVAIIVIIILYLVFSNKEKFLNPTVRDDIQGDWSVEEAVKDLIDKQEYLIRKYKNKGF